MFLTDKWDHVLLVTLQFVSGPKLTLRISASWDDSHLHNYAVRGLCKVSECWSGCSGDQCGHSGILGLLFPQMRLVCTSPYRRLEIMERYRGYLDIPFSDLKFTDDEPLGIGTSSKVGILLSHLPFTCRNAIIYFVCTLVLRNLPCPHTLLPPTWGSGHETMQALIALQIKDRNKEDISIFGSGS